MRAAVDLKLSGVTGPWDLGWSADLGCLRDLRWLERNTAGNPSTTLGHPACHHFLRLQAPWICCFFVSQRPLGTARLLRCWEDTCGWFFFNATNPTKRPFHKKVCPLSLLFCVSIDHKNMQHLTTCEVCFVQLGIPSPCGCWKWQRFKRFPHEIGHTKDVSPIIFCLLSQWIPIVAGDQIKYMLVFHQKEQQ